MAEEKKQKSVGSHVANAVGKAAGAAKNAAAAIKAAAKAASGDVAGAVFDVLKNPELMKAIIITVVVICFMVVFIFLAVGAAIVQMVEMFLEEWNQNFYAMVTAMAIENPGNKDKLMTDALNAGDDVMWQTLCQFFEGEDNHESGTDFDQDDYQTTVDSVIDQEAFAGADGALIKRINLIKTRVQERGNQLSDAMSDYGWDGMCLALAMNVCEMSNNFFLYNGIASTTVNIDVRCFTLTDIQCVKILAAFCTQYECDIQSADIWALMNYMGWYDKNNGSAAMQDSVNAGTIYDTSLISRFTEEFYGAYSAGTVVGMGESSSIELDPPEIPIWKGVFVPQYLLEEQKQLLKMEEEGLITLPRDLNDKVKWEECSANYEYEGGMGLIDYLFTGSAFASFSRTDYTGIDEPIDEFLAKCADAIAKWWKSLWSGEESSEPSNVNVTKQGINGKCTVTQRIYADGSASTYSVRTSEDLYVLSHNTMVITQSGSNVYTEMSRLLSHVGGKIGDKYFYANNLLANTEYSIYLRSPDANGGYNYTWVDTFTTVFDTEDGEIYQAYQIEISVDITYRARSIDELAFDIIGLWPGELSDVEYNSNGSLRAAGHADNHLLKLNWKDSITDADGNTTSMEFTRLESNQYEYYLDYVEGIANTLNMDTTGLFTPDFSYGDTIVTIANEEYHYYHVNSLTSGYRYWEICKAVTGENYNREARNGTDWSAVFVLSCAYQCGYLGDGNCFGGFGCNAATWPINCTDLYNGLREYSTATRNESANYKPSPGDVVFFSTMGAGSRTPEQVGIVLGVTSDGKLLTIEGGSHDEVQKCTYGNYKVGSYAYGTGQNTMYISSYISPDYASQYEVGTQYLYNHALVSPSRIDATQIHVNSIPTTTILVGAGRFRLSQLRDVLDELEDMYPYLINDYYPALSNAVDTAVTHYENNVLTVADISNIHSKWFDYMLYCGTGLGDALSEIAARNYVGPLIERIEKDTGFNWNKTAVRREILWQIATSTDQIHIARQVLLCVIDGKDNDVSDEELLTFLMSPAQAKDDDGNVTTLSICTMTQILQKYQTSLWPEDHAKLQQEWITCAEKNMNVIREKYLNGTLS